MDAHLLNHGIGADIPPRNSRWQGKFINDKIPLRTHPYISSRLLDMGLGSIEGPTRMIIFVRVAAIIQI